jgi:hypothetical protein
MALLKPVINSLRATRTKKQRSSEKLLDAITAAGSKTARQHYPAPPYISDVVKRNLEGFALNLPMRDNSASYPAQGITYC